MPEDMKNFRHIEKVFLDCSAKRGYEEVRTPTLEYLHLFTATGTLTSGMLRRVYSFLDWDGWSGERVVLRPDGTIPAARLFSENEDRFADDVSRFSYVGNTFTFEETGKERRERWQCGVELIGTSQASADVELVTLANETLKELEFDKLMVKLSHAGLIKSIIAELCVEVGEQTHILDQVLEGNIKALGEIQSKDPDLNRAISLLMDVKGDSIGFLENFKAMVGKTLPRFEPSLENLNGIAMLLDESNCPYQIDIASGRGFEYYTGAMFQFYVNNRWVGGGGRYDDLIALIGGPDLPASGFALYVDKLMDLLGSSN
jgi:histidyl-tRNA synthetase